MHVRFCLGGILSTVSCISNSHVSTKSNTTRVDANFPAHFREKPMRIRLLVCTLQLTMMMKDMVAVVAAAVPSRGIGYQGEMVRRYPLADSAMRDPVAHLLLCLQPWRLPGDLAHFARVTQEVPLSCGPTSKMKQNAVIMGRKTWESLPAKFRPLPGRTNVVLSRNKSPAAAAAAAGPVLWATSFDDALTQLKQLPTIDIHQVFVIGGADIYRQALEMGYVNRVMYTEVSLPNNQFKFDTFFPELPLDQWQRVPFAGYVNVERKEDNGAEGDALGKENDNTNTKKDAAADASALHTDPKSGLQYQFVEYRLQSPASASSSIVDGVPEESTTAQPTGLPARANHEEEQYLDLCRHIIENGSLRGDRTGTGTLSVFGTQMKFSLRDGVLPLLTTKRTFWRGVAEELLWFVAVRTLPGIRKSVFR
jgi:dihydrofolate reductase / thymidylate synthase